MVKPKCVDCEVEEVEDEGDLCDDCMYQCEDDDDMFEDD